MAKIVSLYFISNSNQIQVHVNYFCTKFRAASLATCPIVAGLSSDLCVLDCAIGWLKLNTNPRSMSISFAFKAGKKRKKKRKMSRCGNCAN